MDAVEFLKEGRRMCDSFDGCDGCPGAATACCFHNDAVWCKNPEGVVATVEQWSKDHPIKTRQSEFLKIFPNADLLGDVIDIDPCRVEKEMKRYCGDMDCNDCKKSYWNEEVDK